MYLNYYITKKNKLQIFAVVRLTHPLRSGLAAEDFCQCLHSFPLPHTLARDGPPPYFLSAALTALFFIRLDCHTTTHDVLASDRLAALDYGSFQRVCPVFVSLGDECPALQGQQA